MSREINQLSPVGVLDPSALLEIEQFGDSFRTSVADVAGLAEFLGPWTADHNAGGFDLINLGGLTINNPLDTFQYIFTPDAIVADRTVNLPLLVSNDTLVTELHTQTLENKTIDLASNTLITTFAELNAAVSDATLVSLGTPQTLTNKSIDLANNTITGTTAEFNAALTDNDFATLAGVETLTNKSIDLANNTLTTTFAQLNAAVSDATLVDLDDAQTLTNKSIDLGSNTITTTFAQLNTAVSDATLVDLDDVQTLTNKTINTASNTITIVKADISDFPIQTGDIADDAVTLAKIQNIATNTILGRVSGGSGIIEELTGTQATTLLDTFTDVLKGLVPASGGGTTNFLRADGTFASPSGAGEQNTISSDGGGLGLTATISKVGVDLRVRSLAATSPLNVNEATDLITFTIDLLVNADIAASAGIVNSKLADIATATLLGRVSGGSGVREELSGTQATTLLDTFTDALKGLAPASGGGTTNFLRADGNWVAPPSTGYATIEEEGTPVAQETVINFTGAGVTASAGTGETIVDVPHSNSSTDTLTNKTINLANNTLSTTFAQLNTAVSDATLVDLDDAQTLTNKSIDFASNTITTTFAQLNTAVSDATLVDLDDSQTLTNKSINLANNTITGTFAEFNTAVSDATLVDLDDVQTLTNKTINSASNTITIVKADISDFPIVTADITDDAVTFAKTQNIATDRFLGRITAGSGNIEELTPAQATSMLDQFTAALQGVVPLSGGGTTNFLRADGTWTTPMGSAIKSGTSSIARNGTVSIVFNTAFATAPNVVVSFEGNTDYVSGEKGAVLSVYSISTTGFTVRYDEPDGSGPNPGDFQWIATTAGDP